MVADAPVLGIVAGGGALPASLVAACRAAGRRFFVLALEGFADPALVAGDVPHAWIRLGAGDAGLEILRRRGVGEVAMAGSVERPSLSALRPDWRTARLFAKIGLKAVGDDGLLRAVIAELESEGFRVIGLDDVLTDMLAPPGVMGAVRPDKQALSDLHHGARVALGLGALDVGQGAVVQQGIVLAVEAIEGTDAMLSRCAALKRDGAGGVLVKMKKPRQDGRVDLPVIGARTIEAAAAAGLRGVAAQAGGVVMVERANVLACADALGLFVYGVSAGASGDGKGD